MSNTFHSNDDREELFAIVRTINLPTLSAYGPSLTSWSLLARISPGLASRAALADIFKAIRPEGAMFYGPLLDAWAAKPADRLELARILRMINPLTVQAYGPPLDAWANKPQEGVRFRNRAR